MPMTALVLVENEVTAGGKYDHWKDVTGERYQYPNQYKNKIRPGRKFVYYRGVRRADGSRGDAEYFGAGVIGDVFPDPENDNNGPKARWKWICEIDDFQPFPTPVPAKINGEHLEKIPANFWGVAVRELPEDVLAAILKLAGVAEAETVISPKTLELPDMNDVRPRKSTDLLISAPKSTGSKKTATSAPTRRSRYSKALGKRGEEVALQHLREFLTPAEAATLRWVSEEGETPGWDIEYTSSEQLIAVEVKATGGSAFLSLEITANELTAAKELADRYHLVLVANVKSEQPDVETLVNPASLLESGEMAATPMVWRITMQNTAP